MSKRTSSAGRRSSAEIHELEPGCSSPSRTGSSSTRRRRGRRRRSASDRALRTGEPFDLEVPLVTARGRRIWVRAIGRAHVEGGTVVRVGGVLQDIDARKRAEEELRRHRVRLEELVAERTRELEKSRSRLVEAQAVAHLGSWDWDAERDVLTGSEEFYRLFDVPVEELTNLSISSLLSSTPTTGRRMRRAAPGDRLRTGGSPYQAAYRVPLRGGGCRHVSARGVVALDDGAGRPGSSGRASTSPSWRRRKRRSARARRASTASSPSRRSRSASTPRTARSSSSTGRGAGSPDIPPTSSGPSASGPREPTGSAGTWRERTSHRGSA